MWNILVVQVLECLEKLVHDVGSLVLAEELIVNDVLEKLAAVAVFEYEEADVVPLPDLVELDDVRVVQLLQDLYFINESLQVLDVVLLDGLDRDFLLSLAINC